MGIARVSTVVRRTSGMTRWRFESKGGTPSRPTTRILLAACQPSYPLVTLSTRLQECRDAAGSFPQVRAFLHLATYNRLLAVRGRGGAKLRRTLVRFLRSGARRSALRGLSGFLGLSGLSGLSAGLSMWLGPDTRRVPGPSVQVRVSVT
jgi:hypothetical protein